MGIIHCDIRAENYLVDEHGILKLADFKTAKKLPKAPLDVSIPISERGSIGYMAYELFLPSGGVYSFSSDIFALGCLLYLLRRGALPYGSISEALQLEFQRKSKEIDTSNQLAFIQLNNQEIQSHLYQILNSDPVYAPEVPETPRNGLLHQQSCPPFSLECADLISWMISASALDRPTWYTYLISFWK